MINEAALLEHYRKMAGQLGESKRSVSLPIQQKASTYLQEAVFPNRKIEAWHYTAMNPLLEHSFAPADEELELTEDNIADLLLGDADGIRIVLYNGRYQEHLSHIPDVNGLYIESLQKALASGDKTVIDYLGKLSGEGEHLFNALNTALIEDGVYIKVAAHTRLAKPIEILHVSLTFSGALIAQPRNLIVLEEGAEASLVESYESLGDSLCFNNIINEVYLVADARLKHSRLQNESRQTRHLASVYVEQGKASRYECTSASLGALWSRTEFNIEFVGEGADADLHGLYLAGDNQANNNHLNVSHAVPGCSSREYFKGILKGHGRAVFDGTVKVHEDAQQTDAHLSNANLLLSRDAEIDTKPILEINADDVKCSHGTTVGQIDYDMLFYLRSRGVPENTARQMICQGFASEIVEHYDWEPLRQRVEGLLEQRLQHIGTINDMRDDQG